MPSEFRPAAAADLDAITELLRSAFHAAPDAPFLDHGLLEWKYFAPGPAWNGSRSYVLFENESLVAHGCAWPVRLVCDGRSYSALTLIDWAGVRTSPGAGFRLVRHMASLADILISIGGSAATRHIMPRIGFRVVQEQTLYARVLRPWRQFRTRPGRVTAREIGRLLRNTSYALSPRSSAGAWSADSSTVIDPKVLSACVPSEGPASLRTPEFLRYMTECPAAQVTPYTLSRNGSPVGYAVASVVNRQARIAEMRISASEQADWNAAVAAILRAAPDACELIGWSSDPRCSAALQVNGFRARDRRSIFLSDPNNLLAGKLPWNLTLLDDDSAFLNVPEYPYAT